MCDWSASIIQVHVRTRLEHDISSYRHVAPVSSFVASPAVVCETLPAWWFGTNPTRLQGRVEDPRYCATMCHMSIMFHESWIKTKRKAPSGRRSKKTHWNLTYPVRPELRGSNISFRTIASDPVLSLCICTLCHFAAVSPDPVNPVPHTCLCQLLLQLLSGLQFLGSAEEICELVESALVLVCLFHSTKFCLVQRHYTQNFDIYHLIHTTSYIP